MKFKDWLAKQFEGDVGNIPVVNVGGDEGVGTQVTEQRFAYYNINGATTAQLKPSGGQGVLHAIQVNTPAAGTITVYDNAGATGNKIATITLTAGQVATFAYDVYYNTGLTVVTTAATDITVAYR